MINSGIFSSPGKIKMDYPTINNTGKIESRSSIELHANIKMTLGAGGRLIAKEKITLASPEVMIDQTEISCDTNDIEIFTDHLKYKNLDERTIQLVKNNVRWYADYKSA
jgi:hypothetical protein